MARGPQPATPQGRPPDSPTARRTFGRELKRLRVQRNMTQSELGKFVHLDKSVISRMENGQRSSARNSSPRVSRYSTRAASCSRWRRSRSPRR
ncbi:helix-turn-helix transcriptional regulator [Nocardia sp. NPDC004168]|uniref:helix-turn-helix transcriptional regulator n=1 Tax=Nocardia sp. NPDC004168 TaxID=3154452 RepID=UPI0033A8132E